MIELTLPYPVSANSYWRSRVMRMGRVSRSVTYISDEAKAYKHQVALAVLAAGFAQIEGRVQITYTLHPHRPKDWVKRAKADQEGWEDSVQCLDLDNAQKVLLDALKGVVMQDDKWVRKIVAERGEPVDGGKLVVIVEKYKKQ